MYDTHCHPYLAKNKSQEEILERFFDNTGIYLNSIGCDIESSLLSIELAKRYRGVHASIGIHPTHTLQYMGKIEEVISQLEFIYQQESSYVVGIGEAGLDYHWLEKLSNTYDISQDEIIKIQKDFFISQIRLAKKLDIPLIIHNRNASEDVIEILLQENFTNFVFHCFSEDLDYANRLLSFAPNCKLGFGGVATFKNAKEVQEVVKNIPLKNIIIETDSPYLTPSPFRGKEENEPFMLRYILSYIIDLREESREEIQKSIFSNSCEFFHIKKED